LNGTGPSRTHQQLFLGAVIRYQRCEGHSADTRLPSPFSLPSHNTFAAGKNRLETSAIVRHPDGPNDCAR
jgi:hypothetical protein